MPFGFLASSSLYIFLSSRNAFFIPFPSLSSVFKCPLPRIISSDSPFKSFLLVGSTRSFYWLAQPAFIFSLILLLSLSLPFLLLPFIELCLIYGPTMYSLYLCVYLLLSPAKLIRGGDRFYGSLQS